MQLRSALFAGVLAGLTLFADTAFSNTIISRHLVIPSSGVVLVQSVSVDGEEITAGAVTPKLVEAFLGDPDGFIAALDDLESLAQVVRAALSADPENAKVIVALADRNPAPGVLDALSDGVTQAVADFALRGEQTAVSQILADVSQAVSGDFADQVTEKVAQVAPEVAAEQAQEEDGTAQDDTVEGDVAAVDADTEVLSEPTDTAPAIGGDGGAGGGATDGTPATTSTSSGASGGGTSSSSSGGSSLPAAGSSGSGGSGSTPSPAPLPASPA